MHVWHLTPDAPRVPLRVHPGAPVEVRIGTWPIEPGQSVAVIWRRQRAGVDEHGRQPAAWRRNAGVNSYWSARLGPFDDGDTVTYAIEGQSPAGATRTGEFIVSVGSALYVALLWHQHQPLYRDVGAGPGARRLRLPWVRLHALRDYYGMAAIAAAHDVRVTINLTPVLLRQIDDYIAGATDRLLDLSLRPVDRLSGRAVEALLSMAFDADWHRQIQRHRRYRELFEQRAAGGRFSAQDVRDVQMWANLAWFGHEFRTGVVRLATGESASVQRFVDQQRGFTCGDLESLYAEQQKILRAIVPLHRQLQAEGRIEVSTSPAYHPILPLLIDTDAAPLDRQNAARPPRFAHAEDAAAQVKLAIADYESRFGTRPAGMWPPEAAVSIAAVRLLGGHGLRWIVSDAGVLARSGKWGYEVARPDVACQPYRVAEEATAPAVFFRDPAISDAIGFRAHAFADPDEAAGSIVDAIANRLAGLTGVDDRVLTVALDGENAWGAYQDDGRPFLHAFYRMLAADRRFRTVTFSEYLSGNSSRTVPPHARPTLAPVYELATGSWIDEPGSAPGVDLGTWLGEPEENVAWSLLEQAHQAIDSAGARHDSQRLAPAREALYAAEGSDWFWWFGRDQDARHDARFDALFRRPLWTAYRAIGAKAPKTLRRPIVSRTVVWTFSRPIRRIAAQDRLTVRTHCPGRLTYWSRATAPASLPLTPAGGVLAGTRQFQATVGPFDPTSREIVFRFTCEDPGCPRSSPLCEGTEQRITITT